MTLLTSLVEVRTISCDRSRSEFDEQKIEEAARLIVEAEGIINPLVLNRTGINSFEVVEGHFEYYAAARAREIDLAIAETVAAYIVEEDNKTIARQVEIFRKPSIESSTDNSQTERSHNSSNVAVNNLETRLNNFESRIDNRLYELKSEYNQKNKELEVAIKSLKDKLPEQIEPQATFNQADLKELIIKLKPILRSDKQANTIAQNVIRARPFSSLSEVMDKTEGLGDKKMLRIVDSWLYSG